MFWIKPRTLIFDEYKKHHLIQSDAFDFWVDARKGNVLFLIHINPEMQGVSPETGKKKLYWIASNFTHLKPQPYHVTWVWDTTNGERNGIFLNGVRQIGGSPYRFPGHITPAEHDVTFTFRSSEVGISEFKIHEEVLGEEALREQFQKTGVEDYTDEGYRFDGEKFVPKDVDFKHPVYETSFEDESELKNWTLEGGDRAVIEKGSLVLYNEPKKGEEGKASHLVCWLGKELPSDYLMEFTVTPKDRKMGLNIVFFNARGIGGESVLDPSLEPRAGEFHKYHSGDLNNYHLSYFAAGRDAANLRKNKGFQLVSMGADLIGQGKQGEPQTVRIYKKGGKVRVIVDDIVALKFDDDGKRYGPVLKSGWVGLRQMGHTGHCAYGHFKVWPLK